MRLFFLVLSLAGSVPAAAGPSPSERALEISRGSSRLRRQAVVLRSEAKRIERRELRALALAALDGKALDALLARRGSEKEIVERLKSEGLLSEASAVFPSGLPMPFAAAAAGIRLGHHAYPGGLLDHSLMNLRSGLGLTRAYRATYGVHLDDGVVRAAAILHDVAKTWTLPWTQDGAVPDVEARIAGTGAHHVLSVAAALMADWPAAAVVALACAHAPPKPGVELEKLTGYLRAAAVVAGKTYAQAGLSEDGRALAAPGPIEGFVNYLDDHDYMLSETTHNAVVSKLAPKSGWELARALAEDGDLALYRKLLE